MVLAPLLAPALMDALALLLGKARAWMLASVVAPALVEALALVPPGAPALVLASLLVPALVQAPEWAGVGASRDACAHDGAGAGVSAVSMVRASVLAPVRVSALASGRCVAGRVNVTAAWPAA